MTDGARADLKKEMTKKGVRKTIVDGVLAKLLGSGSAASGPQSREGSENGDASSGKAKEYVPPSLALQGRRPTVTGSGSGISRTVSSTSARDISRPSSRAAMAASPTPATPSSESNDVRPVYVSC